MEPVPILFEEERGCGYRKVGAFYLVCPEGSGMTCDRMPYLIKPCPTCGERIRQTRSYQWINMGSYFEGNCEDESHLCHEFGCPICFSDTLEKCMCFWVGSKHYTPQEFLREVTTKGISKRIPITGKIKEIPEGLELNETWVLLAHPKAGKISVEVKPKKDKPAAIKFKNAPALFYAFKPTAIEVVVDEAQANNEKFITDLRERGFTPVIVIPVLPDGKEQKEEIPTSSVATDAIPEKIERFTEPIEEPKKDNGLGRLLPF